MMKNSLATLPLAQLKRAVSIREQIESLELELNQLLGASASGSTNGATPNHKQAPNPATQRVSWSKHEDVRGARLSPAGRAKISAVVAARWERYRAAKAKQRKAR